MDTLECKFFCVSSNIIKSTQKLAILHLRLSSIKQMIQNYSFYHMNVLCLLIIQMHSHSHRVDLIELVESGGD